MRAAADQPEEREHQRALAGAGAATDPDLLAAVHLARPRCETGLTAEMLKSMEACARGGPSPAHLEVQLLEHQLEARAVAHREAVELDLGPSVPFSCFSLIGKARRLRVIASGHRAAAKQSPGTKSEYPPRTNLCAKERASPEPCASFLCLITPLCSFLYGGLYGGLYERAHIIR